MRYLQLRIRFPPERRHPMHRSLDAGGPIRRSYLRHWNFSDPEQVTTLFRVVGDVAAGLDDYVAAMEAVEAVDEFDVTRVDDRSFYVYVREAAGGHGRRLRALLAGTDLLVVPPIEYRPDGEMLLEIAGESDELRTVVDGLPEELSVSVDRLGEYDARREAATAVLTERQAEAVTVAREAGYYEVPREAGVREVADALDCSRSTAADHLRKAEARLVALYADGTPAGGGSPDRG